MFLILIIAFSFIFIKNKKVSLYIALTIIITAIVNNFGFKMLFHRARPDDMLVYAGGYSYPSGHSFVAMAIYGLIIYLIYKSNLNKKLKIIIIILLGTIIALIGISRIYLGVHFPSDVTAGFICGIIYLIIFSKIVDVKGAKYEKK